MQKTVTCLPIVVSGFNPAMFLATSIGSTFARLRKHMGKKLGSTYMKKTEQYKT